MPDSADHTTLTEFITRKGDSAYSAQVVNRTAAEPIQRMVDRLFDTMDIDLTETEVAGIDDDLFLLLRDGEVIETTPLSVLEDTLLLVNSDLYTTGALSLEHIDIPDVLLELSDTVFTLRGYPDSNTEKLVLTLVSRYIEHLAWRHGSGTLRTSFQRLSRLDDERGTREVYRRLGQDSATDVHVYGVPDWEPPAAYDLTVHGVTDDEIMRHWFVVHRTDEGSSVAMVAVRTDASEWSGFWTYDEDEIDTIDRYIRRTF